MSDDPVQAMDALLDRLVAALAGGGRPSGELTSGSAADDLITAAVTPDGRVASIQLDPRMARHPEQIAAGIVTAVNQAARARPPEAAGRPAAIDDLRAIQADSLELTKQLTGSLVTALEGMKPR
jgi:YbaB/EbfC DNA-binding family